MESEIRPGKFITLEGSEGVGKSSNIECVCKALDARGIAYFRTREPGGTEIAEQLRQLLLQPSEETLTAKSELLLMFAARSQHIEQQILPRLEQGEWVVCDRFTDATFAYQGYARGLGLQPIRWLEQFIQEGLNPDLTILLDLDPQIAMQRIADRPKDRMEQEALRFYEAVRNGYLERAGQFDRFHVIDASCAMDDVARAVTECVDRYVSRVEKAIG
ncbi:MAG: dTMP kinase [Pseudomonadota bacterium]